MSYGKKIEQKKPPKSVQRSGGGLVYERTNRGGG
jgi:hypothetical protein